MPQELVEKDAALDKLADRARRFVDTFARHARRGSGSSGVKVAVAAVRAVAGMCLLNLALRAVDHDADVGDSVPHEPPNQGATSGTDHTTLHRAAAGLVVLGVFVGVSALLGMVVDNYSRDSAAAAGFGTLAFSGTLIVIGESWDTSLKRTELDVALKVVGAGAASLGGAVAAYAQASAATHHSDRLSVLTLVVAAATLIMGSGFALHRYEARQQQAEGGG